MADPVGASVDAAIAAAGTKTTYTGAGISAAGWLFSSEFVSLVGVILAVFGFAVTVVFKVREDRRSAAAAAAVAERARQDSEYHAARMAALQAAGRLE